MLIEDEDETEKHNKDDKETVAGNGTSSRCVNCGKWCSRKGNSATFPVIIQITSLHTYIYEYVYESSSSLACKCWTYDHYVGCCVIVCVSNYLIICQSNSDRLSNSQSSWPSIRVNKLAKSQMKFFQEILWKTNDDYIKEAIYLWQWWAEDNTLPITQIIFMMTFLQPMSPINVLEMSEESLSDNYTRFQVSVWQLQKMVIREIKM